MSVQAIHEPVYAISQLCPVCQMALPDTGEVRPGEVMTCGLGHAVRWRPLDDRLAYLEGRVTLLERGSG